MNRVTVVIEGARMVEVHLGDKLLGGRITALADGDHSDLLEALEDSLTALNIVYPNGSPVLNAAINAITKARGQSWP